MSERFCVNCQKLESQLSNPLKVCAKCQTQQYCSRDCQKAHWKTHKKDCGRTVPEAPSTRPLTDDQKQRIMTCASQTIELMRLLSRCEGFNPDHRRMSPSVAGLKYVGDFVQRTFRDYWADLLPQRVVGDFMVQGGVFFGLDEAEERRKLETKYDQIQNNHPDVDLDAWPPADSTKYNDGLSRTVMAAEIVLDPKKQSMMGGVFNYPEEVKELCRRMSRS